MSLARPSRPESTLSALLVSGRGILVLPEPDAADGPECGATPALSSLCQWISAVVLPPATFEEGAEAAVAAGLVPGVRADRGTTLLPRGRGARVSEGLDGLGPRLAAHAEQGARFAYWRAVLDPDRFSGTAVHANTHALARFAAACQQAGLISVLELRITAGGRHGITVHEVLATSALRNLTTELARASVDPSTLILATGPVLPGSEMNRPSGAVRTGTPTDVALRTVRALTAAPAGIAEIALVVDETSLPYLSGVVERATSYLDSTAAFTFCLDARPDLAERAGNALR